MKLAPTSIPETLNRHLSAHTEADNVSINDYINRGAALVTPEALQALRSLLPALRRKTDTVKDSDRLRHRLKVLTSYFDETAGSSFADPAAESEIAFALLYFLKGFDRIPDSVPEIGLLDDAMIVEIVLQRHLTTLRGHWLRTHRPWPANL